MQGLAYAEFWKRMGAFIIDCIILFTMTPMFMALFCLFAKIPPPTPSITNPIGAIIVGAIFLGTCWLYYAFTECSKKQGSVGKRIMAIMVTDLQGNRIKFRKASLRFWGKFVVFPGFSLTGMITQKRALHDIIAGTVVVAKPALSPDNVGKKIMVAGLRP